MISQADKAAFGIIEPKIFKPEEYYKREYLKYHGFEGFITVRDLKDGQIKEVPTGRGLLVVLREDDTTPDFLDQNVADTYRKSYTVDKEILKNRWVQGHHLIYVSAAEGLRERVRWYLKYKKGCCFNRKLAGRIVWQIEGHDDFVLAWREEEKGIRLSMQLENFACRFRAANEEGKHVFGFVKE